MTIVNYLRTNGVQFDRSVNTLTGGEIDQTVSERAAYGAGWRPSDNPAVSVQDGPRGRGWCLFCAFLDHAVQPNHCGLQFTNQPTPGFDMVRAGVAFATAGAAIYGIVHLALKIIWGAM